ncbi:protein tipE-like isoform X1 [Adelges cooleyi]|uniref:protein tipE-like isoform X1 n=1 Tax=Adelges cooleyi TaxID=133065 RepID=UPI00217FC75E|nr:protein tipE-like isoform X1 [Adelges cooleyi]
MDEEPVVTDEEKKEAERKRLEALRQKILFYLTAFFILLGVCSLFVFLFLVPFIIEPAISTLLMDFDETPASCVTTDSIMREGASNCSLPGGWASCREGCTKEIYQCAQIFVNYTVRGDRARAMVSRHHRRSLLLHQQAIDPEPAVWTYSNARIFPNVKGCGYPPHLNCSAFHQKYFEVGSVYPCYYSREEPSVVITELDLAKSVKHLIYSIVFPIPCFVTSIVYVALAYFWVYAGQSQKPKTKRRVVRRMVGGSGGTGCVGGTASASRHKSGSEATPLTTDDGAPPAISEDGTVSPANGYYRDDDDASIYGEQLRSTLAVDNSSADYVHALNLSEHTLRQSDCSNEPSREWSEDAISICGSLERSIAKSAFVNSTGNLTKTMTTCILTPPGPTAEV